MEGWRSARSHRPSIPPFLYERITTEPASNMDYDLCVRLRDSGFPQEAPQQVSLGFILDNDQVVHIRAKQDWIPAGAVRCPTLTELMLSIGSSLTLVGKWETQEWFAESNGISTKNETPELAVADLYILNNTHEETKP